ncbi:MAG: hypothetical protein KDC53_11925, partial [Saprospiraceae bacterium]|nr:hypothetical protein [Saprospiraceae bacterium]
MAYSLNQYYGFKVVKLSQEAASARFVLNFLQIEIFRFFVSHFNQFGQIFHELIDDPSSDVLKSPLV